MTGVQTCALPISLDEETMTVTLSAAYLETLKAGAHTVIFVYADGEAETALTVNEAAEEPGGDDQKPGGDDQKPGGDDQKPGEDDQKPGGDDQQTGGDGQKPGTGDAQQPGGNQQSGGKAPSADDGDGSKAVQTGDTTNVFGAAGVCVLALGMAGAVVYVRRKRS